VFAIIEAVLYFWFIFYMILFIGYLNTQYFCVISVLCFIQYLFSLTHTVHSSGHL